MDEEVYENDETYGEALEPTVFGTTVTMHDGSWEQVVTWFETLEEMGLVSVEDALVAETIRRAVNGE